MALVLHRPFPFTPTIHGGVNRESQAIFRCRQCGHTANADTNAARNILTAATTGARTMADTGSGIKTGCASALAAAAMNRQPPAARAV